jgi:DNA helicase-2/ATP-dependent DNA helicase PcrA
MICFLRLVQNKDDDISLGRIINVPPRGIGDKTILALHSAARTANVTPGDVLLDLARGSDSPFFAQFAGRAALPLADFGAMLSAWRSLAVTATVSEVFDRIAQDIRYKDQLDDGTDEGKERWENVVELHRLADEYDQRPMSEFLENIALVSDQDTIKEGNVPTLLTLHAAKGLEFGVVFIVGLDDGILPHSRSFDEPEEMEEERRLFYVGITRAKDRLYILRAQRRGGRGYAEETVESRFLADIPSGLVSGQARAGKRNSSYGANKSDWVLPAPARPARIVERKYRAGMHITHPVWGDGIVLDSRAQDDDEIVDVVFNSVGIKRLAASLAKLTIIK